MKLDPYIKRRVFLTQLLFSSCLLGSLIAITGYICDYFSGQREYTELRNYVFAAVHHLPERKLEGLEEGAEGKVFHALSEINGDYLAWIKVPGSRIDYPVVQGIDNIFYLNHTFYGSENSCGCIFADYSTDAFVDDNVVLYGHNMKDGSMFSELKKYTVPGFYEGHKEILFLAKGKEYRYIIFSCQICRENDLQAYCGNFVSGIDKLNYLAAMERNSLYLTGIRPVVGERLLTLSTCYGKSGRMIVQGVLSGQRLLREPSGGAEGP